MAWSAIAALSGPGAEQRKAEQLRTSIDAFLSQCRRPELLEPGEPAIALRWGVDDCNLALTPMGKWLSVEAVGETSVLSRRVTEIRGVTASRMELATRKLGGKPGKLFLYDAFRPSNDGLARKGKRQVFGELFRRMLQREYAGWRVSELSTEAHLEESLSPAYPRALLVRGKRRIAAMGCPPGADAGKMLSFGLIWLDYLSRRDGEPGAEELAVFLPSGSHAATCLRLRYLTGARYRAFCYDEGGQAMEIDLQDAGNVDSSIEKPGEGLAIRLEPEAMVEAQVRARVSSLDAALLDSPVHGQVCSFAAAERGVFDLLAVDYRGRLAVIELKASESVHLPLQALDYWIHVQHHLARGALAGLFPGIPLSGEPPRLLLAAPALCHHPSNERVLRYFREDIEVERIGLAHNWSGPVRIMFRHGRTGRSV
ncbi:MAG: hypothetical protein JNK48_14660 [Bryobacterales bacterium]|nr:hypothetical protein [Bryobacterales bacterium]